MLLTVVVVVTHSLAIGVVAGVLWAMALFARRVAHLADVEREVVKDADGSTHALYTVTGELFFATSNDLAGQFHSPTTPGRSWSTTASRVGRLHGRRARRSRREVRPPRQDAGSGGSTPTAPTCTTASAAVSRCNAMVGYGQVPDV